MHEKMQKKLSEYNHSDASNNNDRTTSYHIYVQY